MNSPAPYRPPPSALQRESLADVLERVLDKGLVIAGDITVNLCDVELLTLKVRLLLASADTAQKMGIDWWREDPHLSSAAHRRGQLPEVEEENRVLRERVDRLEAQLARLLQPGAAPHTSNTGES